MEDAMADPIVLPGTVESSGENPGVSLKLGLSFFMFPSRTAVQSGNPNIWMLRGCVRFPSGCLRSGPSDLAKVDAAGDADGIAHPGEVGPVKQLGD